MARRDVLAAAASVVAVAALVISLLLYLELRASRDKERRQGVEVAKIRGVLLATANAVLLEHKTINLIVREQRAVSAVVFPPPALSGGLPTLRRPAAAYAP